MLLSQPLFWWPHQSPPKPHIKSKAPCPLTILAPAKSMCSITHRSAAIHWCCYFSKYSYLREANDYFALPTARESTGVTCSTHWCILIYEGSYMLWWPDGWIALNLSRKPLICCCWHCLARSAGSKPIRFFRVSWFPLPVTALLKWFPGHQQKSQVTGGVAAGKSSLLPGWQMTGNSSHQKEWPIISFWSMDSLSENISSE